VSTIFRTPRKTPSTAPPRSTVSGHSAQTVQKRTGAPDRRPPDRRVLRTHRTLPEALIQLIRERGWDEITVQDVCQRADVGRSTFYVHFADKEELLVSGFGDLRKHLRQQVAGEKAKPLGFALALFQHAREYQLVYRALLGRRTAQVVYRAFLDVVIDLLSEDVAEFASPGPLRDAAVRYLAGAFWELLQLWATDPNTSSALQVDETFRRLTMPVLRELRKLA
jgi:AcrR family transcriptional regulator